MIYGISINSFTATGDWPRPRANATGDNVRDVAFGANATGDNIPPFPLTAAGDF